MNQMYFDALLMCKYKFDVSVTCCQCDIVLINVVSMSWKLYCAPKFVRMSLPNESGVLWSFSDGKY